MLFRAKSTDEAVRAMEDSVDFGKVIMIWISENVYLIPYKLEYTESIKTGPDFQMENLRLNYTIASKML